MGNPDSEPSQARRVAEIAGLFAIAAVILWFSLADGGSRVSAYLNRSPGRAASQAHPVSFSELPCRASQLQLMGTLDGCADPAGRCDAVASSAPEYFGRIILLHDSRRDYVLYVGVDGGYHGPGRYQLSPWGDVGINADDGISKVTLRDAHSGDLWQSIAGSFLISSGGTGGTMDAAFQHIDGPVSPATPKLLVAGPWSCADDPVARSSWPAVAGPRTTRSS